MEQRTSDPGGHGETVRGVDGDEALDEFPLPTNDFLKALASPTRQRIMLLFGEGSELSVGEVALRAGISQATASQQLMLLRRGGVVVSRRDGKTVFYRADRDGMLRALSDLRSHLLICC